MCGHLLPMCRCRGPARPGGRTCCGNRRSGWRTMQLATCRLGQCAQRVMYTTAEHTLLHDHLLSGGMLTAQTLRRRSTTSTGSLPTMQVRLLSPRCRISVPHIAYLHHPAGASVCCIRCVRRLCFATPAELWDKHHVHAELQQEKANLWTKKEWPTWNPCNQTELDRNNGYWAVSCSAMSAGCYHACTHGRCLQDSGTSSSPCASVTRSNICKYDDVMFMVG